MQNAALKYTSLEEYLAAEETALEKSEYYKGEVFSMAGTSFIHNQIVRNTLSEIHQFLKGKAYQIFPSDLKIHIEANSLFTYPDLSIICGRLQFWNDRTDAVLNPSVIIEVLSPGTKDYDRGGKFILYRDIPSLQEYILLSATQIRWEQYTKQSQSEWKFNEYKTAEENITIAAINFTTALGELYRDVDFTLA